jgi:hypothetical protein
MKQKKSNKPHPEGGTIDPELDRDLECLVKIGIIKKHIVNGGVVYGITEKGDEFVEENLLKNLKIEDLP